MKRTLLAWLVVFVCCFASSFAQVDYFYLPQVADGAFAGGSMRTTFIVFNQSSFTATITIRLTNDTGQPMVVTIPGLGTDDEFGPLTIGPGQTKILQTSGTGTITAGAARIESNYPLGVSAIFTLYDGSGAFLTEAGVGNSEVMTNFMLPVDAAGGFNTGVALFAPQNAVLAFTLRRMDGTVAGTTTKNLNANNHLAQFVIGAGELFPAVSNFTRGTLEVLSTTPVAAVVLRQNTSPLSNTTLPVVEKSSQNVTFNLPQVANGGQATATNIRTTFILFNLSSSDANVQVTVRKPDATAFPVTLQGFENDFANHALTMQSGFSPAAANVFDVTLKPGGSSFLQTTGIGEVSVGSAQIESNVPIGVSAIFTLYNGQSFLTEAGVGDAAPNTDFTVPVEISANSTTGVALFNTEDLPSQVNIWLLDENGVKAGELASPLILPGRSQTAKFIAELFPEKTSFRGSMGVSASEAVAALTLRQNNSPLSYTTLPVVEGSYDGTTQTAGPLLEQTKTGIAATANSVVNATLQAGFKLSGTISGPLGMLTRVNARSTAAGGNDYEASVDVVNRRYLVIVPAGAYEVGVCFSPESLIPLGMPTIEYTAAPTVTVAADTVRNVTVPSVTLSPVFGTVSGMGQIPAAFASLNFVSADGKIGATAMVLPDGSYSVQLPNGSYVVSLAMVSLTNGQSSLGFYNIGPLNVSGPATGNFTVPSTVILSGTASRSGAAGMPANSYIMVGDTASPVVDQQQIGCVTQLTGSMGMITAASGAYQLYVPKDRGLSASIWFPISTTGFVGFPNPARNLGSLSANRTENFSVPALPTMVTMSGKVTDGQGQPVADVTVSAYSDQITGAASVFFTGGAQTDSGGNYTMNVLSGTSYGVTFSPPQPEP